MKMEKYPLCFFFLLFAALVVPSICESADDFVIKRVLVSITDINCKPCNLTNQECVRYEKYQNEVKLKTGSGHRCQCKNGWSGNYCQTKEKDECLNPKVCDRRTSICLTRLEGSYKCICKQGFWKVEDTQTCYDVNECAKLDEMGKKLDPCSRNGPEEICINTFGSFACECRKGFLRKNGKCVKKLAEECPTNQFMDANKRCRCRKTIARYNDGDICYDCNKNSIGLSQHSKFPEYAFRANTIYTREFKASRARSQSPTSWAIKGYYVNKTTGVVKRNVFLEIDLRAHYFICAMSVGPSRLHPNEFVRTYKMSYSVNNDRTTWVMDPKIYQGPNIGAARAFEKVILPERPLMRMIRIHPQTCNKTRDCSLRLELYGQRIDENGKCTMNADKETFNCMCNDGYIGDGSTCRKKQQYRIIGKAGVDYYTYGKVLSVRGFRVKFQPDNAIKPVFGNRYFDYAVDVIPDKNQVRRSNDRILFRKLPHSKIFYFGVIQEEVKGKYNISQLITHHNFELNYHFKIKYLGKKYLVNLDDLRFFEPNPNKCDHIANSIYVGRDYPGSYSCLCPVAGEMPSGGKCGGTNKFFINNNKVDAERTLKSTKTSISYIDGNGYAWVNYKKMNKIKTMSADIFNSWLEPPFWWQLSYQDSVYGLQHCRTSGCPQVWALGQIKMFLDGVTKILIQRNIFQETFIIGNVTFSKRQSLCTKIAQCPINSTCVATSANIPSTYSCACNGPVIDNVCTKPIEIIARKKRRSNKYDSHISISRVKAQAYNLFAEHVNDGFIVQHDNFQSSTDRFALLENMTDATLYDDASYWLRDTTSGEGMYDLGHVGGRLLGEKDSVVFVAKDAPKGKSRFSIVKKENTFKELDYSGRNTLWSCREDNQCGKPDQGICISDQLWNFHKCVCAEGFKNFWGPKGDTCVPMDYN